MNIQAQKHMQLKDVRIDTFLVTVLQIMASPIL